MRRIWVRLKKFKVYEWLNKEGAWMALVLFGMGCFGWGFSAATMNAQTARANELAVNFAAFNSALATKDKLIKTLVGSTVTATAQANEAVAASTAVTDAAAQDVRDLKEAQKVKIDKLKKKGEEE